MQSEKELLSQLAKEAHASILTKLKQAGVQLKGRVLEIDLRLRHAQAENTVRRLHCPHKRIVLLDRPLTTEEWVDLEKAKLSSMSVRIFEYFEANQNKPTLGQELLDTGVIGCWSSIQSFNNTLRKQGLNFQLDHDAPGNRKVIWSTMLFRIFPCEPY